jgi:chemotaxis signal transduction protein
LRTKAKSSKAGSNETITGKVPDFQAVGEEYGVEILKVREING